MHVDHRVVRQPGQGRDFLDEDPVFEAFLVLVAEGGNPLRSVIRLVLHPVALAVDAVGMRVHGERAVLVVRDHDRGDLDVVADQVSLGVAVFREEQLVQVGEVHDAPPDLPIAFGLDRVERLELAGRGAADVRPQLFRDLGRRLTERCVGDVRGGGLAGRRHPGARNPGRCLAGNLLALASFCHDLGGRFGVRHLAIRIVG